MPTVLREGGYRVYFSSHDVGEPPHVHVDRGGNSAKFWLEPVRNQQNFGFSPSELRKIEALITENRATLIENGMNSSKPKPGEKVKNVRGTPETLSVDLADGRTITVPLSWYPRLLNATEEQRQNWQISGAGYGIHWPDIDEDLTVRGLLAGAPAPGVKLPIERAG